MCENNHVTSHVVSALQFEMLPLQTLPNGTWQNTPRWGKATLAVALQFPRQREVVKGLHTLPC